jgi:hypothetical protein
MNLTPFHRGPRPGAGEIVMSTRTTNVAPRNKPDARPMRIALGTGFLAVMSAILSAIVAPPQPVVGEPVAGAMPASTPATQVQQIVYVQLKPGETAPPGARVIDAAAPTPITVVTVLPGAVQKPVVVKTTQSGKKVP